MYFCGMYAAGGITWALFWRSPTLERYWWGEGEFKFYIDGDREYPTVCSTGTEDYFGGAWSFGRREDRSGRPMEEETFSALFSGYPFYAREDNFDNAFFNRDCPPMRSLYRWHVMDPIVFAKDLRSSCNKSA